MISRRAGFVRSHRSATERATACSTSNATAGAGPPGFGTRDGKLWFPTQDGVAVIDPEAVLNQSRTPPPVSNRSIPAAIARPWPWMRRVRIAPRQGELRDPVHGAQLHQLGKHPIQVQAGRTGSRLGRRRHAAHGVLLAPAAGRLHVPGDRGQSRRRVEYGRATVCASGCCRRSIARGGFWRWRRWASLGWPCSAYRISHRSTETGAGCRSRPFHAS